MWTIILSIIISRIKLKEHYKEDATLWKITHTKKEMPVNTAAEISVLAVFMNDDHRDDIWRR